MSSKKHSEAVNEIAECYEEYEVIARDQGYPGIFEEPVPDHELEGRVDLLLADPENKNQLKVVETGSVSSLNPETVERKYVSNAEQLQRHIAYFEELGYGVDPEVDLRPKGRLEALKHLWEDTTGVFTWGQAREVIDDDDILSQFKNDEVIIFDSLSKTGSELYSVNEEIEEYEELVELFYRDVI